MKMKSLLLAGLFLATTAQAAPLAEPGLIDLVQVADLGGLVASPDRTRIAFRVERARVDTNDYPSDWYLLDLASGSVRQIGPGGAAIYHDPGVSAGETPVWSPDGRYLYYRALVEGAVQLWRADAGGAGARAIVQDDSDIKAMRLSPDGTALILDLGASREATEFAEQREYDSGILVDQTVELGQNVFRGALINGRPSTERLTGNWFGRDGLLWRTPLRQRRVYLATGDVTDIQEPPPPAEGKPKLWQESLASSVTSSQGDVATSTWNWNKRFATLSLQRKAGGAPITCMDDACRDTRIVWTAWRAGRDELIFSTEKKGAHALYAWEPAASRVRLLARSEGSFNGGRDSEKPCAVVESAAICVTADAGSPPRLEQVDLQTGARSMLFDPNEALRASTIKPERLEWKGKGGHAYTGWLFVPPGAKGRVPFFLTYYNCEGFLRGGLGDEWPLEPLARAGIASMCINQTVVKEAEDSVKRYDAALEGIDAVVKMLDRRGLIDPKRVGMGGLSFGSEVTLWTAVYSDLLAAASVTSPSFELSYYWLQGVRGRDVHANIERGWGLKSPEETPARWKKLSPAANVDRIKAPLLMQMPEQEARNSTELYARLTHSTTPAELYVYPDEPHLKFLPRHKLSAYQRNIDWFRYWLQGEADSDPLKAAQYKRWETLAGRRKR